MEQWLTHRGSGRGGEGSVVAGEFRASMMQDKGEATIKIQNTYTLKMTNSGIYIFQNRSHMIYGHIPFGGGGGIADSMEGSCQHDAR